MKVSDVDLRFDIGKKIKIVKVGNRDNKKFEGMTGTVSNPFGEFHVTDIGLFLDKPFMNCDTVNLNREDELEFIKEF